MKRGVVFQPEQCADCGRQFKRRVGAGSLSTLCGPCMRTSSGGYETYREEVAAAIVLRELLLVRR